MFKLNILGEKDKVVKTYETSVIKYGLIEDLCILTQDGFDDKNVFEQIKMIKPLIKSMFVGVTDEELRNVDFIEVLQVFKKIREAALDGYGVSEKN